MSLERTGTPWLFVAKRVRPLKFAEVLKPNQVARHDSAETRAICSQWFLLQLFSNSPLMACRYQFTFIVVKKEPHSLARSKSEEIYRPEKDSDAAKYVEDLVRRASNLDFVRHEAAGLSAGSLISHPEKEADHVEHLENDHVKDLENLDFVRHEAAGLSAGSLISHPEKEADHVEHLENDRVKDLENLDFVRHEAAGLSAGSLISHPEKEADHVEHLENDHVKDLENLDFVRHEAARLSAGSVGHPELCHKPCLFLFKVGGCPLGAECNFCHEPHERAKLDRRMRQLLHDLDEAQQLAIVPWLLCATFNFLGMMTVAPVMLSPDKSTLKNVSCHRFAGFRCFGSV